MDKQNESQSKEEAVEMAQQEAESAEQNPQTGELETCQAELFEWKERCARVTADLENYRRRVAKDQIAWAQAAQSRVLLEMIAVLDDFDRACEGAPEAESEVAAWIDGITMIRLSFQKALEKCGVTQMDNYEQFDPEFHEAIAQVEVEDAESGSIVEVLQQGYLLRDMVLRPARVSVAK